MSLAASVATLCALGSVLLTLGIQRIGQQASTSRRVAEVLGERPPESGERHLPRTWLIDLRQIAAQVQARDAVLRAPAIALACVTGLIGLATFSPVWLCVCAVGAAAGHALGARERRRRRFEGQALDAMGLFSSGLRAGYSVPQAIDLVAAQSPEPTSNEFAVASQEIGVGVPLPEAMMRMARRTPNSDYELVAIIIRVQHEAGGNLALILDSVGSTLRERFELRRQVNALTAQQRLSSLVLTVLPFALLSLLFVMDRSFVDPLFTSFLGRILLTAASGMVFTGWTIMRSMGRVEV
jgi:Flp pilus assembly protein TadB